jgi:hypothetical protein
MAERPEEPDAAVNAAPQEDERRAKTRAVQTHDHDVWFVAVLVCSAPEEGDG